jgi:hypothetical protein
MTLEKSPPITALAGSRMLKSLAHTAATKFRHVDKGYTSSRLPRMFCVAVLGNEQVFGVSGSINERDGANAQEGRDGRGNGAFDPFPAYMRQYEAFLPWKDAMQPPPAGRDYSNCAEAHVWLELTGRSKNPRQYTIASFNSTGEFAAPCVNCEQWVKSAFRFVETPTRSYEGHPKQKTTYRV